MSDSLRLFALFPQPPNTDTEIGKQLWRCRYVRAQLAWITPGSYGWCRTLDVLKATQRQLLEMRTPALPAERSGGTRDE